MSGFRYSWLLGTVSVLALSVAARAADFSEADPAPPAVSALNGKWEIDAGAASNPNGGVFRGSGSLSMPVGDRFGVQGDFTLGSVGGLVAGGGALHFFKRDPRHYLLGVTVGGIASSGASVWGVGPEAEYYAGRFSLEAWGGYATASFNAAATTNTGGFIIADLAYYPTDNWRLSIGGSSILGTTKLRLGTEYLFQTGGMPLSLTADARIGNAASIFTVGIKGYFGGNDPNKSLIDRHRQDDPHNKGLDLYNAVGDLTSSGTTTTPPVDPETACRDGGGIWLYNIETHDYECVAR